MLTPHDGMIEMKYLLITALLIISTAIPAQSAQEIIELPAPETTGGGLLMEVLNNRQTTREFNSEEELSLQTISNLLWAAYGVNRPETGRRTAPSALDMRETDIYMATSEGLFLFDPEEHCLYKVLSDDIREFTGIQDFTQTAPVNLIYALNFDRVPEMAEEHIEFYAAADVGFISQNVYLFCASEGLVTAVLAWIDLEVLTEKMDLPSSSRVLLSQPVGYPVQE